MEGSGIQGRASGAGSATKFTATEPRWVHMLVEGGGGATAMLTAGTAVHPNITITI